MVLVGLILTTDRHILNRRTSAFHTGKLSSYTGLGKQVSHAAAWGICDENTQAK